jgi:hypothetical protein
MLKKVQHLCIALLTACIVCDLMNIGLCFIHHLLHIQTPQTCIVCDLMNVGLCFIHHLLHIETPVGARGNGVVSSSQISSVLLSRTLLFVSPIWTTSREHLLLGCNRRLFCRSFVRNFHPAVSYSIYSISPLCSRSFCTTGWSMLSRAKAASVQTETSGLSNCSWRGMGTPHIACSKKSDKINHYIKD